MDKPIIVGYDGSPNSALAVESATRMARGRHLALRVITVWTEPAKDLGLIIGMKKAEVEEELRIEAEGTLTEGLGLAAGIDPEGAVVGELVLGSPSDVLIEESADAAILVLGAPSPKSFLGRLSGSTSRQVVPHARCPVVVARRPAEADSRDVVVGVDGSRPSMRALDFAVEEASWRGSQVRLIHTWDLPPFGGIQESPILAPPKVLAELVGEEMDRTAKQLGRLEAAHPDVVVEQYVMRGSATKALVESSHTADLIVVGSRGLGGFRGLLQGSVSQAVTYAAECSVAVVH